MLLACSVETLIHINRSHLLASRVQCGLGLEKEYFWRYQLNALAWHEWKLHEKEKKIKLLVLCLCFISTIRANHSFMHYSQFFSQPV